MSTLAEIQTDLETLLSIDVPDSVVILAYNEFSNKIYKVEFEKFPHRQRKESSVITVPVSGYDLTGITDIRNYDVGFEVYLWQDGDTELKFERKLQRSHPSIDVSGRYNILGDTLKLGGVSEEKNVKILYTQSRTAVARDADISSETFGYDQDLEDAFREYMRMKYFDSEYDPQNIQMAETMANNAIQTYYSSASWS